jgi:hypothetical protein
MEKLGTGSPEVRLPGAQECPEPGYEEQDLVWGAWCDVPPLSKDG